MVAGVEVVEDFVLHAPGLPLVNVGGLAATLVIAMLNLVPRFVGDQCARAGRQQVGRVEFDVGEGGAAVDVRS